MIKIPWAKKDVSKHKKGLTDKQKEKWCEIANSVLSDCLKDGGKQSTCEAKAIKIANSKVGNKSNNEEDSMNKKFIKVPKNGYQFVSDEPSIDFKDVDEEGIPKSFSMMAYTGAVMSDIFGGSVAVDVSGIDFDGKKRFPILEDHMWDNKIGVANSRPGIGNNVAFEKINILNNGKAREFAQNLRDGFPYQASISVRPSKVEEVPEGESAEVNDKKFKGPGIILRTSKFREASVCVFGRDANTKVKSLSDDGVEEVEVEYVSFPESEVVEFANTPDYDGVETKSWSSVSKGMKAVVDSYYKHHSDAEKDDEIEDIDDMPAAMKSWIASLTLAGKKGANSWDKLFYYPVVNHSTKKLNKNGVESAKAYAKKENRSDVAKKADSLWQKHWSKKDEKKNKDGGKSMNLAEMIKGIQESHPDLHKAVTDAFADYDNKIQEKDSAIQERDKTITSLQSEKENLSKYNEEGEKRIAALEKEAQLRKEKELKDYAESIVDSKLGNSNIPTRLHSKVKGLLDHNQFVDQEGNFDEQKFAEKIDAEVKEWSEAFKDSETVLGFSSSTDNDDDDPNKQYEDLSDHMLSLISAEQKQQ